MDMGLVLHPAVGRPARPVVSVCIANYNGEALLDDCIASVLAQDAVESIEIIVHDDASSDGSVAVLRGRYPQVELLASQENVGFSVANNRMVAQARGDYVLLLNNDAELYRDAVAALLAAARAQGGPGILTLPQYDWETGVLVDRGCLVDPFLNPVPNLDAVQRDVAYVIGACLWIPRAQWNELGGLPEWMGSIGEDLYLCGQARLRGWPVQALGTSGYRHWQGRSFGGNRPLHGRLRSTFRRRSLSERNKTLALFVLTPGPAMWPLLVLHLLALALEGSLLGLLRREPAIWSAIYWPAITAPIRARAELLTRRAREQSMRRVGLLRFLATTRILPRKLSMLWNHGLPELDRPGR
jgi:GT2 family glycosyltransferase